MADPPIEMREKEDEMKDQPASTLQRWSGSSSATLVGDQNSMAETLVEMREKQDEIKGIWAKEEPKVKVRVPIHNPGPKCKVVFWTVVGIFMLGPACIGGPILIHRADRILRTPDEWINYPNATKVVRQFTTSPSTTGHIAAIVTNPAELSIESLLALLTPPASIASSLTGIPASVLSQLEGPEAISAYLQNVVLGEPAWVATLVDPAWEWLTSQNVAAATIIPQVVSLQSIELSKALGSLLATTAPEPEEISSSLSASTFTTSILVSVTATRYESVPLETVFIDQHVHDDDDGLSNGAKIGIGIGVPVFVIMLAAIIFMGIHIRRNRVRGRNATMFDRAFPEHPVAPCNGRGENGSTAGSSTVRYGGDDDDVEIVQIVDGHGNVQEYIADHSLEMAEPIANHGYTQMNGSAHHRESSGTQQDTPPNVRDSYQSQSSEPTVTNRHSLAGSTIKRKPVGSAPSRSRSVLSINGLLACEHVQGQAQPPRVSMAGESNYEDALSNTDPVEQAGASARKGQRGSDAGEDIDTDGDDDTVVGDKTGDEHAETADDGEERKNETGGQGASKQAGVAQ